MRKILIVNHSEDTMELIKMWLSKKGLEVKCTKENDALSLIMKFKPDVVIVDALQHEVAKKIKKDEKLSDIPVILMAGYVKNSYDAIADDIIPKPFNPQELYKKIQNLLSRTG